MKKTRNGIRTLALLLCAALAALPLGGCRDSAASPSAPDGGESSASSAETPAGRNDAAGHRDGGRALRPFTASRWPRRWRRSA